jgi:amino acid adenylation domain-containing protein
MNTLSIIATLKQYKVVPRLDGDRLKLVGETKNLPDACLEQVREHKAELISFLKDAAGEFDFTPILPIAPQAAYAATNAQKRLWILCQFKGGSAAYNIVTAFYLKGKLMVHYLNQAFQSAIQRHESLRTVFTEIEGTPCQVVLDQVNFTIELEDISRLPDIKAYLHAETEVAAEWDPDLKNGPLLRVKIFHLAAEEHAMIFALHHLVSDGWSISVMVQEVMRTYEALCKQEPVAQPPLKIHYKDYAHWLLQRINGHRGEKARIYWGSELAHLPPALNLPTDFPRPVMKSFEGAKAKFHFEPALYRDILHFCKKNQVTQFNFFRTAVSILLYKLSGQHSIIIGTPVSGRNHFDLENQIGLYVNTLPLKIDIDGAASFTHLLKQVADHSIRAFEFQDYPFDRIIEDLQVKRDTGRSPLFDVMMVLQNTALGDGTINLHRQYGFELNLLDEYLYGADTVDRKFAAKFDLTFNFDTEPDNRFFLEIEYATRLFKSSSIHRYFQILENLIRQALALPLIAIGDMETVTDADKQQVLEVFNQPIGTVDEPNITSLFTGSFKQYAARPAIISGNTMLTYAALGRLSGNVAAYLLHERNLQASSFTGLLMERSEWVLISMIGILKAGGVYVPVDVHYPVARISYILTDAAPALLIVDDAGKLKVPENYNGIIIHINDLKTAAERAYEQPDQQTDLREHRAYLIYTSGSTGAPKGVEICHRNTIAFLKWAQEAFAGTDFETLYASTSYCFDLSVFELFFPLLQGKCIRLLNSALEIPDFIQRDHKVLINTVPSVVRNLLDNGMDWQHVTALNMAGEPVPGKIVQELAGTHMEVRNLYGPSEDTTYSTMYRMEGTEEHSLPIGKPVGYTHLYIMDADRHLLPIGMEGEIYVSGQSVARGYLNKPALTAEKFLDDPFVPGMRMYRTGDSGKWLPDGNVMFTGRIDDQVKIRGYRIEPGEIQYWLEQYAAVEQAVVAVLPVNGTPEIVAYWTSRETVNAGALKSWLQQSLPAYMIPAYWMQLDTIPLNNNGKVDKKQLPLPSINGQEATVIIAPASETELRLQALWNEVLQTLVPGVTHNFFDMGGHSLKATRLRSLVAREFDKELTLDEIFSNPTIAAQAHLLDAKTNSVTVSIPHIADRAHYPISFAQERLWVVTQFEEASAAYNMPAVFIVQGVLQPALLEAAFRQVIARHEIVRTVFREQDGVPVQVVLPPEATPFAVEVIDLLPDASRQAALAFLQEQWQVAFDLHAGPLLRCMLVNTGAERLLSFYMHHIISDGWSVVVLYRDIMKAYQRLIEGNATVEPPLPLQYRDFAVWQREMLTGERLTAYREYWLSMFRNNVPVLELPADFHRPEVKTYNGDTVTYTFDSMLTQQLFQLAQQAGGSIFMVLFTAVSVMLKKYANQNDIVMGTTVAGRDQLQLKDQIGFYVNTLPILVHLEGEDTFAALLSRQRHTLLQAFEYQEYPFEMLVDDLQLKRDLSRNPLFDVMLVLQNIEGLLAADMKHVSPTLSLERLTVGSGLTKYDLTFTFAVESNQLSLALEFNTDLFKPETAERLCTHLHRLFKQVTVTPAMLIKDLSLLDHTEHVVLASKADQTQVSYDTSATIVSLFAKAALQFPDRIALLVKDAAITYRELDLRSGQLARMLVTEHQVKPEELIALHFDRSEWMLIGILAVLKAGAAYVPIDPTYPVARIDYIIEDSAARLLLYDIAPQESTMQQWSTVNMLDITSLPYTGDAMTTAVQPHHLAYVIYTSGTAGQPKGVLIEHRNVTRLLFNDNDLFDFNEQDVWSLFHSYCFDFSVWEMYGALLKGGKLVMVPKEVAQDSTAFFEFLVTEKITVVNQTPTAFRSLVQLNKHRFPGVSLTVRYLIFGGEALQPEILKEWQEAFAQCRNINMYGITETTVHVTYKEITPLEIKENRSNIGLPIPTLSCYVLDVDLQPVPVGVIGELCVGGAGVARGYLNKPELTAQRFVAHPLQPGEKLYRSGDYARILAAGDIEYIGRKDEQVKIRGHRIETGEIVSAILQVEGIRDAVVLPVKTAGDEYELVAYFIPETEQIPELHSVLRAKIPAYMIPAYFIALPAFPLNKNGKLDKDALPAPTANTMRHIPFTDCRNEVDQQIVAIWKSVLEIEHIGIRDNFFDLGGHSLKATRVISKIHEAFGIKIDLKNLFIDPTVEHLSNYIETIRWMDKTSEVLADGEDEMIF